jgi:hypothetical protein
MAEVVERKEAQKSARMLTPTDERFGLREHKRQDWVVLADEGTTMDEVLQPQYWAHVSGRMQQFDRIEISPETSGWLLELLVLSSGRNWAQVHVLAKHTFEAPSMDAPAGTAVHKVEWKGPHKKFCVIRIADSALIQEGFESKDAAGLWMANHERVSG